MKAKLKDDWMDYNPISKVEVPIPAGTRVEIIHDMRPNQDVVIIRWRKYIFEMDPDNLIFAEPKEETTTADDILKGNI